MPMIQAHALNLSFGTGAAINQVLHDVSLSVADGESFGLVGESGSGKTTVLRCLAGQYRHWNGELSIAGAPLQHKIPKEHFRKVQMVFQDPYGSLHPKKTVDDTLAEPLAIHGMPDAHAAGDAVLVAVANRVRAQLREDDLVARLGGDEFAVLLTPLHKTEDAERIADKILESMEMPIALPGTTPVLTSLSIGIAVYPDHGATPGTLLDAADAAMYQAKRLARGAQHTSGSEHPVADV